MPWKEISAMDQRVQFVGDWLSGQFCKTDLCMIYGINQPPDWRQMDSPLPSRLVASVPASSQCR